MKGCWMQACRYGTDYFNKIIAFVPVTASTTVEVFPPLQLCLDFS